MQILTRPSSAAFMAIIYITLGALIDVWTAIYYLFFRDAANTTSTSLFWCAGFFCTGLVLLIIGLGVGRIGREARHAEMPPAEVTPAVAVQPASSQVGAPAGYVIAAQAPLMSAAVPPAPAVGTLPAAPSNPPIARI